MPQIHRFSDFSVKVVQADLLRLVGYKTQQEPDGQLRTLIAEATAEAEKLVRPQAVFALFEEKDVPPGCHIFSFFHGTQGAGSPKMPAGGPAGAAGGTPDAGSPVHPDAAPAGAPGARTSAGARKGLASTPAAQEVALSVCTIGPLLEERVSEYSVSGELTRGLILDAAGSVLAEVVCDFANEKICAMAAQRSLHAMRRISPGYGRWKIEEQEIMFGLLPADSIGVTLTRSFMMIPRKSVSFAVRLLGERPHGEPTSPCALCGREDCEFRR